MNTVKIKRIYDPVENDDGFRILVDRLWPRGISISSAKIDLWMKDIAPSTPLRVFFNHDVSKWDQFREMYIKELDQNPEVANLIRKLRDGPLTLLYSAVDTEHNNAVVIKKYIEDALSSGRVADQL
ncbi:MAG: DUF488 domain-containing protein [Thermoplasmataceae archaeon]|jgi:uncharacterized protein YeaO (DUF488 family)